jgi:hypothetical protein
MTLRIANGQGFYGDWPEAPKLQLREGPIDYLTMDYLAEATMSILARKMWSDPTEGYANDFVYLMDDIMAECLEQDVKVVTNAGGLNPESCRDELLEIAEEQDLDVSVGIVTGDDIKDDLENLEEQGADFTNKDTDQDFEDVRDSLLTANVYYGARPIVDCLGQGADIVVTGRCTDSSVVIGPAVHEFGWDFDDYDKIGAGVLAGHLLECGGQATGGNYQGHWKDVENQNRLGYPIAEFEESGDFWITKHDSLGGKVERESVMQQLVYEMDDPSYYIVPGCAMDITETDLYEDGENRVRVENVKGHEPTDTYKVSMSYLDGYFMDKSFIVAWPDAKEKAERLEKILRQRLDDMDITYDKVNFEYIGVNGVHGENTPDAPEDPPEVVLRVAIRGPDQDDLKRYGREFASMVFRGPSCANMMTEGRPQPRPIPQYWPALLEKDLVQPETDVQEVN